MTQDNIKRSLINRAKEYASVSNGGVTFNNPEKYKAFRDGQDDALEMLQEEMYLNMQYYMEYCQLVGYVTPQEWLVKHKHF